MADTDLATRRHVLYRFFRATGELLYVGITCNPTRRFDKHGGEKDWWGEVARIDIQHFADRPSVLAAERLAIEAEAPIHNIRMNDQERAQVRSALPCRLVVGAAYALGLRDGTCPVGVVVDGDEDGVVISFFDWLVGWFCVPHQWIAAADIARWCKAELADRESLERRGYSVGSNEKWFDMEPLARFQTRWTDQHRPKQAEVNGGKYKVTLPAGADDGSDDF